MIRAIPGGKRKIHARVFTKIAHSYLYLIFKVKLLDRVTVRHSSHEEA